MVMQKILIKAKSVNNCSCKAKVVEISYVAKNFATFKE